jgi:16S rRNA G966 N2-methylase RsmD
LKVGEDGSWAAAAGANARPTTIARVREALFAISAL